MRRLNLENIKKIDNEWIKFQKIKILKLAKPAPDNRQIFKLWGWYFVESKMYNISRREKSQNILQFVQILSTIQISHLKFPICDPLLAATYLQVS